MKLKKELMLFSIISIVLLAGCARAPSAFISGGTNGVIIKTFSPDLVTAEGGNSITFDLFVKNVGATKAENLRATVFGLSNEWTNLSPQPQLGKLFDLAPATLSGADPSLNFEGEEGSASFSATTPSPGKAVDVTYDANARVLYKYSTVSENLLRLTTIDYLRSITPPGQPLPREFGVLNSQSSSGPLLITVKTRLLTIPAGATTVKIQFEIQNVGGGRVFSGIVPSSGSPATIPSTDLDVINSITVSAGTTCAGASSTVKLIGGKSRVLICDVTVGTLPSGGFTDQAVKFTLNYNYFVETATQVSVLKALT